MSTVAEIDRLVVSNDEIMARLLPRLGPRARQAYLADRNAWIALRRGADAGKSIPTSTLAAQKKIFDGWARAFRAAAQGHRSTKNVPRAPTSKVAPAAAATSTVTPPLAATASRSKGLAGALAVGIGLVGLVALARGRKRK